MIFQKVLNETFYGTFQLCSTKEKPEIKNLPPMISGIIILSR